MLDCFLHPTQLRKVSFVHVRRLSCVWNAGNKSCYARSNRKFADGYVFCITTQQSFGTHSIYLRTKFNGVLLERGQQSLLCAFIFESCRQEELAYNSVCFALTQIPVMRLLILHRQPWLNILGSLRNVPSTFWNITMDTHCTENTRNQVRTILTMYITDVNKCRLI